MRKSARTQLRLFLSLLALSLIVISCSPNEQSVPQNATQVLDAVTAEQALQPARNRTTQPEFERSPESRSSPTRVTSPTPQPTKPPFSPHPDYLTQGENLDLAWSSDDASILVVRTSGLYRHSQDDLSVIDHYRYHLPTFGKAAVHPDSSSLLSFAPSTIDFVELLNVQENNLVRYWMPGQYSGGGDSIWIEQLVAAQDRSISASLSEDGVIHVWDTKNGELTKTILQDSPSIQSIAISPDGLSVATGNSGGGVEIRSLFNDSPPLTLTDAGKGLEISSLAFDRDGKYLLVTGDGFVQIWELTNPPTLAVEADLEFEPTGAALSVRSNSIALTRSGRLLLYDTELKPLNELNLEESSPIDLQFNHDGSVLAYLTPTELHLWHMNDGPRITSQSNPPIFYSFSATDDGKVVYLGTGSDSKPGIYKLDAVARDLEPVVEEGVFGSVSPDGRLLAIAYSDDIIRIFNSSDLHDAMYEWNHCRASSSPHVRSISFNSDNSLLAVSCTVGEVWIYELTTGELAHKVTLPRNPRELIYSVAEFTPNGDLLVVGNPQNEVRIFEVGTWRLLGTVEGYKGDLSHGIIRNLDFSSDSNLLAVVGLNGVRIVDLQDETFDTLADIFVRNPCYDAVFDPESGDLITADGYGLARWDPASGKIISRAQPHRNGVRGITLISGTGQLLSMGNDGVLAIQDGQFFGGAHQIDLRPILYRMPMGNIDEVTDDSSFLVRGTGYDAPAFETSRGFSFGFQGYSTGDHATINLSGKMGKLGSDWWDGLHRFSLLLLGNSGDILLDLRDGSSVDAVQIAPSLDLSNNTEFLVSFPDSNGRDVELWLTDKQDRVNRFEISGHPSLRFQDGLFPDETVYVGMSIAPSSRVNVRKFWLSWR